MWNPDCGDDFCGFLESKCSLSTRIRFELLHSFGVQRGGRGQVSRVKGKQNLARVNFERTIIPSVGRFPFTICLCCAMHTRNNPRTFPETYGIICIPSACRRITLSHLVK